MCRFDRTKKRWDELAEKELKWQLIVEREIRRGTLLEPDQMDKVTRYESSLERSFFKILHELQRLQAVRAARLVAPPVAVDFEMSVHQVETR